MKVAFRLTFLFTVMAVPSVAQQNSSVDSLANAARQALNNLEYDRAESIARLLAASDVASRETQIRAFQLLAAAFFPEEDVAQQPDSATKYLRQLLEFSPDATMPSEISWPGLDAMLVATGRTLFSVRADPESEYILEGVGAVARIPVVSTRRAVFTLALAPKETGVRTLVDSVETESRGELGFSVAEYDGVSLARGAYNIWIIATDGLTGERSEIGFDVFVDTPPLDLVRIPAALDSSGFLPERTNRRRVRNAVIGIGLGAATGFIATAFRGSDPVSSIGLDNRAYVMGGGMTLGGIIGVFTDRAAPVPSNIAHNARLRADYAEFVRQGRDQNAQRRLSYRATVSIRDRIQ